jgi:ElaB/YqjD/DUF883 family membrane-anchored ribosome-binding protein
LNELAFVYVFDVPKLEFCPMTMQRLAEELAGLKDELAALAGENATAALSASREKIDEAAKLLGGVMDDVEQLIMREEENVENFISSRPLTSVAAAFVAGLAIGLVLRGR